MGLNRSLFVLIICFSLSQTFGQFNVCNEATKIVTLMSKEHIEPLQLDDSLSNRVFTNFINTLDPQRIYFTHHEFKSFEDYRYKIDDEIREKDCGFVEHITDVYKKQLEHSITFLEHLKNQKFSYSDNKTHIIYSEHEFVFQHNEAQRLERMKARVKVKTLYRLLSEFYSDSTTQFPDSTLQVEPSFRAKVIDKMICQINHILHHEDGYKQHISEEFLNSITKSYDPHSAYFNLRKKREFDLHLSRESETFGMYIEETEDGEFIISDLSPGGPAWKSNLIHEEDQLISVSWADTNIKEDISCATEASINQLLNEPSHKKTTIVVKKTDGKLHTVTLEKEILRVDDNTIKSFVIHGEKRIGYLSIPSFYSEEGGPLIQGCANDVAKEVIKLKREKIEGLILDLRHNGGGSLKEAIDFSGIFIDEGPICLMEEKNIGIQIVKDFNRGRIYDGPLVVMINAFSASASEILASSLQDYNRAVVVGSHSFGKATGQVIVPLDTVYNNFDELIEKSYYSNMDFPAYIKLTNSKFYRVDKTSNQKTGMTPDISLPSIWNAYNYLEKKQTYALANHNAIKDFALKPYAPLPLQDIIAKSTSRIDTSAYLNVLSKLEKEFNTLVLKEYPIDLPSFWEYVSPEISILNKFIELSYSNTPLLTVKNNESDAIFIEMDELINSINNQLMDEIEKDIFINEAYHIIEDLIELNITTK